MPRPCTDSASSISVVLESSMEKACTSASGSWSLMAGACSGGKGGALGEVLEQEALPVELVGRGDRAGVFEQVQRGGVRGARSFDHRLVFRRVLVRLEQDLEQLLADRRGAGAGGQFRGPGRDLGLHLFLLLDRGQRLLQDFGGRLLEAALAGATEVVRRLEQAKQRRRLLRQRGLLAEIVARQVGKAEFFLRARIPRPVPVRWSAPGPGPRASVPRGKASRTSAGYWRP